MMMDAECWIMDELNIHHPKLIIKNADELCLQLAQQGSIR
jgi:hypothetical protein